MPCREKTLGVLLSLVIAAGGTTAPISPFALPVCTLAVQSMTLSTNPSSPQTETSITAEVPRVQTKTCMLPDAELDLSGGVHEKVEKREMQVAFVSCGDQESDCGEYGHPVWSSALL